MVLCSRTDIASSLPPVVTPLVGRVGAHSLVREWEIVSPGNLEMRNGLHIVVLGPAQAVDRPVVVRTMAGFVVEGG